MPSDSSPPTGSRLLDQVVSRLLQAKGPDPKGWFTALCPFHDDQRTPNLRFNVNGFKCFACDEKGSLFRLADKVGITTQRSAPKGLTVEQMAEAKGLPTSFLTGLGVVEGLAGPANSRIKVIDIPYLDSDGLRVAVRKRLALAGPDRFRWRKGDKSSLYGMWRLSGLPAGQQLVLVEGESDCWALWHHGFTAVGVPGSSSWKNEYEDLLNGFELFIWVEPDQGGQTLLKAVSATFPDIKVIAAPAGIKDPSELHLMDADGFAARINRLLQAAQPASALAQGQEQAEATKLWPQVRDLATAPDLIKRLKEEISARGYAGDPRPVILVYMAITSRLLDRPLNVVFISQSASGKSAAVDAALVFFPPEAFYLTSASSPRTFIYSTESLEHRTIVMGEADSIPEDGPAASAFSSLIADNRLFYDVVEPRSDGRSETRRIEREGPTNIVTTSTKPLREQASTRVLLASIPDSSDQTDKVLEVIARQFMAPANLAEPQQWVDLQRWLALGGSNQVVVPYAGRLALAMPKGPVRLRRDFKSILTVNSAFALLHQAQRDRDDSGRILANPEDYELTRWLIGEYFSSTVSDGLTAAIRETAVAVTELHGHEGPVTGARLAEHLSLARSSVDYRVKVALRGGWIVDARKGKHGPLQLSPGAPLPDVQPLPDLFGGGVVRDSESNVRTPGPASVRKGVPTDSNTDSNPVRTLATIPKASGYSNLHSNRPASHDQAVNGPSIRMFDSEPGVPSPITQQPLRGTTTRQREPSWEEWRNLSSAQWRDIYRQAVSEGDYERQSHAAWMLYDVLRDPISMRVRA